MKILTLFTSAKLSFSKMSMYGATPTSALEYDSQTFFFDQKSPGHETDEKAIAQTIEEQDALTGENKILVFEGTDLSAAPKVFSIPESNKFTTNVYLTRPARTQVKKGAGPLRQEISHHSSDYNIWYSKKLGDRFAKEDRVKALARCCVSTDAGYTKADIGNKDSSICIFFARGLCVNGSSCSYHHRLPTEEDEVKLDITHDIFGRERHKNYRDDMGGVGSFSRENRTLYISGIKRGSTNEDVLIRHFIEWGELEYVRVVWEKSIAFVKYRLRVSAEFAKEAMQNQSLEDNEVLDIRWSNEDPNPTAKQRDEKEKYLLIAQKVAERKRAEQQQQLLYQQQLEYQKNYLPDFYHQYNYNYNYYIQSDPSSATLPPSSSDDTVNTNPSSTSYSQYDYDEFQANREKDSRYYPNTDTQYSNTSTSRTSTSTNYVNSNEVIGKWLSSIGIKDDSSSNQSKKSKGGIVEKYTKNFIGGGYTDLESISTLEDISLEAIGINNQEHRELILKAAKEIDVAALKKGSEITQREPDLNYNYRYPVMYTNDQYSSLVDYPEEEENQK